MCSGELVKFNWEKPFKMQDSSRKPVVQSMSSINLNIDPKKKTNRLQDLNVKVFPNMNIQRLPIPPREPALATARCRVEKNFNCRNGYQVSPRPHRLYTSLTQHDSRMVKVFRPKAKTVPPHDRLRRRQANREITTRALTPPCRRPSWRWWNFRPTPSRPSKMSFE